MNHIKLKLSLIGSNGIPAHYGGTETFFENLTRLLSDKYDITVCCSKKQSKVPGKTYLGANLKYWPLSANGWQSIPYDILNLLYSLNHSDVILYFGPAAGFFLPILRFFGCKKKIIVNHGGLNEWEREKLSHFQKIYTKWAHKCAARSATYNVADNILYQKSIKTALGTDSIVIRYGGDGAFNVSPTPDLLNKYPFLNEEYYVCVSRAQVDNNLHMVLEAFSNMPDKKLVLVSNFDVSSYGINLKKKYSGYDHIILINGIYDKIELNAVRSNAKAYIHSHSRCGTPPSLCEAMYLNLPIISFDVPVNHEVTHNYALFFNNASQLLNIVNNTNQNELIEMAKLSYSLSKKEYTWNEIAKEYSKIIDI